MDIIFCFSSCTHPNLDKLNQYNAGTHISSVDLRYVKYIISSFELVTLSDYVS